RVAGVVEQRDLVAQALHAALAERLGELVDGADLHRRLLAALLALKREEALRLALVNALELAAHADGPRERRRRDAEHLLNLVEELERRLPFAIHLVDERDDRNLPQ